MRIKNWKLFKLQKSKVAKDLSITLFYPALLGYFIYCIFHTVTNHKLWDIVHQNFLQDFFYCSGITLLLLGTLVFYCCDFLGATYVKTYSWWNLVADISLMVLLILTFNSLGVDDESIDQKKSNLHTFSLVFSLFMALYLIRYFARLFFKSFTEDQKKDYTRRALFEGCMFIIFFSLWFFHFYKIFTQSYYLLIPIVGMVGSIIYYIKIIKKMDKD